MNFFEIYGRLSNMDQTLENYGKVLNMNQTLEVYYKQDIIIDILKKRFIIFDISNDKIVVTFDKFEDLEKYYKNKMLIWTLKKD